MTFGEYFRELRKTKGYTQAQIASMIGKSKMLVSGIENSKNGPFSEADVDKLSNNMALTKTEKKELVLEVAKARNNIPTYMLPYISKNNGVIEILDLMVERNFDSDELKQIFKYIENLPDVKNH